MFMLTNLRALRRTGLCALVATLTAGTAIATEITYVSGADEIGVSEFKEMVRPWEEATGNTVTMVPMPASTTDQFSQYRLWLAAENSDIDVYRTDVIWAPQLAEQFIDLSDAAADVIGDHFPSIIESQTVDGRLVAMPLYTNAPALFYRKDLLEKYDLPLPKTWEELTETAKIIQDGERAEGNADMWGFVWQGNAYEGLTCNALEWVKSYGGGQIVEADGTISVNNPNAIEAINMAKSWVGTISPEGVLAHGSEESRGIWQIGNSVFMRNWSYAYALGNSDDSPIKGKFEVSPLPTGAGSDVSAATLGGWNAAVSKYSKHQEEAISLVKFLASAEVQKVRALNKSQLPTVISLYDDPEIAEAQPIIPRWKSIFLEAVPRPSAPTKANYNEVSSNFWSAVHSSLSGDGSVEENFEILEIDLEDLKGNGW